LQLLSTFINTIPGVGMFAKVAVGLVITAGEAAAFANQGRLKEYGSSL
jgi:hypothetical protein